MHPDEECARTRNEGARDADVITPGNGAASTGRKLDTSFSRHDSELEFSNCRTYPEEVDLRQKAAALSRTNRIKLGATAIYLFGASLSIAWGISYDVLVEAGLRADVRLGATGEGSTFVTVANNGPIEWTNVKIVADDQWFIRLETIAAGAQADARLWEFENAYRLPRPSNVFFWEQVGPEPEPIRAPSNYRPSRVSVVCDQGAIESGVSL